MRGVRVLDPAQITSGGGTREGPAARQRVYEHLVWSWGIDLVGEIPDFQSGKRSSILRYPSKHEAPCILGGVPSKWENVTPISYCEFCGNPFPRVIRSGGRLRVHNQKRLCSRECNYEIQRQASRDRVNDPRTCTQCGIEKPASDFKKKSERARQSYCTDCQAGYRRTHYEANRQKYVDKSAKYRADMVERVNKLKTDPCMDCGRSFHPVCMDFDHRPGEEKVANVAELARTVGWDLIQAEIDKCDLVCACCHRLRTLHRLSD